MRIVVSYAREDRPVATELVHTLTEFGHEPWSDAGAHSGGRWWDEILAQIRGCDLLLVVMSPALPASKACALERQYAFALRRHVLPAVVAPISMQGLPSDLVQIHMLDYTRRDAAAAARLFQAIRALPPVPPLPRELPRPPAPPLSYLNDIADRLNRLPGDLNVQHEIVTGLMTGLSSDDPDERSTAAELARIFLNHPQRMQEPAERAAAALGRAPGGPRGPAPGGPGLGPGHGPPTPATPATPAPAARSRTVMVLAWIGGAAVALVLLVVLLANLGGTGPTPPDGMIPTVPQQATTVVGGDVATALVDQLRAEGIPADYASCFGLTVAVGATTSCEVSAAGGVYPVTVRVTGTDGVNVTAFEWYG